MVRTISSVLLVVLSACTGPGDGAAPDLPGPGDLPKPIDIAPASETTSADSDAFDGAAPDDLAPPEDGAECRGTGLEILRFGIAGDASEASVGAGTDVPVLLEWALSDLGECPDCEQFVVLGVGAVPGLCWEAGTPPPCPETAPGIGAGLLVAPGQSGPQTVEVAAILAGSCDAAKNLYPDAARLAVGVLTVSGSCAEPTCGDWEPACGAWANSCGGTCAPGPCEDDAICTGDGACLPQEGCGPGLFDVGNVFLNGKAGALDIDPAGQVTLSLTWTLGNPASCPDCARQIVVGLDDAPLGCVDLGIPETCPSFDGGNFASLFPAPGSPGVYTLMAQAFTVDDCPDAGTRFALGGPKAALGVIRVAPPCTPATCDGLARACGRWEDGCGGLLDCGGCAASKRCTTDGQCKPLSACPGSTFEVVALPLNGGGPVLGVGGGPVVALLRWRAGLSPEGADHPTQIVVGLGDQAMFCREVAPPHPCAAAAEDVVGGFLDVPGIPGVYPVRAALLQASDCDAALDGFGDASPRVAGVIRVGWDCVPKSCADLGLECGAWGDGCGAPLACGGCPEGQDCTPDGRCGTACSQGIFDVDEVQVNHSGPAGSAAPGQQLPVALHWILGNPDLCPGCARQLVIGIDDIPGTCTEIGAPPTCPETGNGLHSTWLTAPNAPGEHTIHAYAPGDDVGCDAATATYATNPGKLPIGTLHVTDGCPPESCFTLGAECGLADDGCGYVLDCGACSAGDLCLDGVCACSAEDDYEDNDVPGQAFDLGTFPDADTESAVWVSAMVDGETDWFQMGAMDEMWAYVNPTAHVEMGTGQPYTVQLVYLCSDGTAPPGALIPAGACTWTALDFSQVPGVAGPISGWRCESLGAALDVELGPDCPTMDDSGRFFISVGTTGGCSAYGMWLHL